MAAAPARSGSPFSEGFGAGGASGGGSSSSAPVPVLSADEARLWATEWYVGNMPRKRAETILFSTGEAGFLLRESSVPNCYAMSKYVPGARKPMTHALVVPARGGGMCFEDQEDDPQARFPDLFALVRTHPEFATCAPIAAAARAGERRRAGPTRDGWLKKDNNRRFVTLSHGCLTWFNAKGRACRCVDLTRYRVELDPAGGRFRLVPHDDERTGHAGLVRALRRSQKHGKSMFTFESVLQTEIDAWVCAIEEAQSVCADGVKVDFPDRHSGWLEKKGKQRWFLLRDGILSWFLKEQAAESDHLREVHTQNSLDLSAPGIFSGLRGRTLQIADAGNVSYSMTAETEEDAARWASALAVGVWWARTGHYRKASALAEAQVDVSTGVQFATFPGEPSPEPAAAADVEEKGRDIPKERARKKHGEGGRRKGAEKGRGKHAGKREEATRGRAGGAQEEGVEKEKKKEEEEEEEENAEDSHPVAERPPETAPTLQRLADTPARVAGRTNSDDTVVYSDISQFQQLIEAEEEEEGG